MGKLFLYWYHSQELLVTLYIDYLEVFSTTYLLFLLFHPVEMRFVCAFHNLFKALLKLSFMSDVSGNTGKILWMQVLPELIKNTSKKRIFTQAKMSCTLFINNNLFHADFLFGDNCLSSGNSNSRIPFRSSHPAIRSNLCVTLTPQWLLEEFLKG